MKRWIDVEKLGYFVALARMGNFGRAAIALGISQSTLSKQIKKFEEELGVELFDRHSLGASLTRSGQLLSSLSDSLGQLFGPISEDRAERDRANSLVIGLSTGLGSVIAANLYKGLISWNANLQIGFLEADAAALEPAVIYGTADAAIFYDPPKSDQLAIERLVSDSLVFVYPPAWRLGVPERPYRLREIAHHPLIFSRSNKSDRRLLAKIAHQRGVTFTTVIEVDHPSTVMDMVNKGVGCTITSATLVSGELTRGRVGVHRIATPEIKTQLAVVTATSASNATDLRHLLRDLATNALVRAVI